jgi:phosphotransferase system IIB component
MKLFKEEMVDETIEKKDDFKEILEKINKIYDFIIGDDSEASVDEVIEDEYEKEEIVEEKEGDK